MLQTIIVIAIGVVALIAESKISKEKITSNRLWDVVSGTLTAALFVSAVAVIVLELIWGIFNGNSWKPFGIAMAIYPVTFGFLLWDEFIPE